MGEPVRTTYGSCSARTAFHQYHAEDVWITVQDLFVMKTLLTFLGHRKWVEEAIFFVCNNENLNPGLVYLETHGFTVTI